MTLSALLRLFVISGFALMSTSCNPFDSGGGGGGGSSGPQTVLVLGDSISGAVNYPGVPPWPSLLKGMRPDWTISNRASAGERMSDGRAKAGSALASVKPSALVIFYGSNNAIKGDMDGFESDLRATIQAGKASGARVVVCTVPNMYGSRSIYNGRVAAINVMIRSAASGEGASIADVAGEFGTSSEARFPDGLHPDLDGQRIIAVSVRERI